MIVILTLQNKLEKQINLIFLMIIINGKKLITFVSVDFENKLKKKKEVHEITSTEQKTIAKEFFV